MGNDELYAVGRVIPARYHATETGDNREKHQSDGSLASKADLTLILPVMIYGKTRKDGKFLIVDISDEEWNFQCPVITTLLCTFKKSRNPKGEGLKARLQSSQV